MPHALTDGSLSRAWLRGLPFLTHPCVQSVRTDTRTSDLKITIAKIFPVNANEYSGDGATRTMSVLSASNAASTSLSCKDRYDLI